ncbi:MAG: hypothetical protein HYU66_06755 [Armatimonadetes bacterium]|nr:hypothetical protein [Armatimonadota bacterium]
MLLLVETVLLLPLAWVGICAAVLGAELVRARGAWYATVVLLGVGLFGLAVSGWVGVGRALAAAAPTRRARGGASTARIAARYLAQLGLGSATVVAGAAVMAAAVSGEIGHEIQVNGWMIALGVVISLAGAALCVDVGRRMGL